MKSLHRKPLRLLSCLAVGALAPIAAQANDGFYVGVDGGINFLKSQNFNIPDGQSVFTGKFKDGYLLGLATGYTFNSGLRPEIALDYRRNTFDSADLGSFSITDIQGHETAYTAMANLWYDLNTPSGLFSIVHPYIGGGIGLARVGVRGLTVPGGTVQIGAFSPFIPLDNVINEYKTTAAWQAGTGLIFDLAPSLAFSADYRYLRSNHLDFDALGGITQLRTRYQAQSAMIGLQYFFGKPQALAPAPQPVSAVAPPPPLPPPPPPPSVSEAAPVDSDGDGVADDFDKCPNTPHGFKVDAQGCIVQQTVILKSVNFITDSDELTDSAQRKLDEVSAGLVGQPTLRIEIDGHTDSRGSKAHNQKLSERRAASVRKYLISNGVKGENLVAQGFGFDKPIASNATEEGRAQNRRVEFIVLNQPPPDVKVLQQGAPAQ